MSEPKEPFHWTGNIIAQTIAGVISGLLVTVITSFVLLPKYEEWKAQNQKTAGTTAQVEVSKPLPVPADNKPAVTTPQAEATRPQPAPSQPAEAPATPQAYAETLPGGVTMPMVYVPGGSFRIGDLFGDGSSNEKPPDHDITLAGFYMAVTEVSQAQWQAIMGNNPSHFKGDDLPVEQVSWNDAVSFCEKLSQLTGTTYRLPTEAEWEYAAREGGKKVRFGNGQNIARAGELNFKAGAEYKQLYSEAGEYRGKTVAVDSFRPNALGLYNMSGNVWEWCADWYQDSYADMLADGTVSVKNTQRRVLRGGSWINRPALRARG